MGKARAVCRSPGTQGFPCAAAGAIHRPEDVRTLAAHLYPRHAVPKPQATVTTPQMAHAAAPGHGRGAHGHQHVVGPSSLAPGAGEKQADARVLPDLVAAAHSTVLAGLTCHLDCAPGCPDTRQT